MKPYDIDEFTADQLMLHMYDTGYEDDKFEPSGLWITSIHQLCQARDRLFYEQALVYLFDKHARPMPKLETFQAMQTWPNAPEPYDPVASGAIGRYDAVSVIGCTILAGVHDD